jgi:hypothetical protein
MDKADLVPHIRKAWIFTKAMKVDELFSGPTALDASEAFKLLAADPSVSYEELYLAGLREGQYNILLKDSPSFSLERAVSMASGLRTILIRSLELRPTLLPNFRRCKSTSPRVS